MYASDIIYQHLSVSGNQHRAVYLSALHVCPIQFCLGDPVRIKVKSANLEQRLLDYELVEPGAPEEQSEMGREEAHAPVAPVARKRKRR